MTILMEKVSIRQNGFDHSQGEGHNLDLTIPQERVIVWKENLHLTTPKERVVVRKEKTEVLILMYRQNITWMFNIGEACAK